MQNQQTDQHPTEKKRKPNNQRVAQKEQPNNPTGNQLTNKTKHCCIQRAAQQRSNGPSRTPFSCFQAAHEVCLRNFLSGVAWPWWGKSPTICLQYLHPVLWGDKRKSKRCITCVHYRPWPWHFENGLKAPSLLTIPWISHHGKACQESRVGGPNMAQPFYSIPKTTYPKSSFDTKPEHRKKTWFCSGSPLPFFSD